MSCEIFILFRCLERCNIYWNGITVLYHYSSPGGGGGGHFHTLEYWECAAGQGIFLSFQNLDRVFFLSFQFWAPG